MKITYTGIKQELSPKLQAKLDGKFAKVSKLLEKRGELEAHVVVTTVRHLHKAEISIPFYEHQLIGLGSDADVFTALCEALEKLETQAVKNRGKWREKHRRQDVPAAEATPKAAKGRAAGEAWQRRSPSLATSGSDLPERRGRRRSPPSPRARTLSRPHLGSHGVRS